MNDENHLLLIGTFIVKRLQTPIQPNKMTKVISIITLLLILSLAGIAQENFNYTRDFKTILAKTKDAQNDLAYEKLFKRFQANDSTLKRPEILALLIGFTDKPAYKPYDVLETERLIFKLNEENKFKQAYDTATVLLKTYPLSYQALYEKAYASDKLGFKDSASYYLDLVAKIMSAMIYTGDGRSIETAMFSLGPADGQHLLRGVGVGIGAMGSGRDKDGNFLDMLEAVTENGKMQMYFNIQHAVAKMFGGKSATEMLKEQAEEETKSKKKKDKKN